MGMSMQGAGQSDGPPLPPQGGQNSPDQPGRTYESDLFEIAKKAAAMETHLPHPDMTGATAGDIHSHSYLFPKDEAAIRNASSGLEINPYHEDRAIIGYTTSIPTDNLGRVHTADNPDGNWGAQSSVILGASPTKLAADLSLPNLPSLESDVRLPQGSYVEASRPDSDTVRQYYFQGVGHPEYFINTRTLG